jgi:competence protein ComEC
MAAGAVERVPLFSGRREWGIFLLVAVLLIVLRLGWEYRSYRDFVSRPFFYTWGEVLWEREKGKEGGTYRLLKVRSDGGRLFYTRSYREEPLAGRRVRFQLFPPKEPDFFRYLGAPYLSSRIKAIEEEGEETLHRRIAEGIAFQHRDRVAAAFYRAIFLGDPLPPVLREKIAALGVSHLVALSGYHLGILWGGIFFLLRPLYRRFQERFFPWRYDLADLGSFSLLLLAGYLWLTGMPPSLVRSYAMLLFGWGALLLGIEIVSFPFLLVTALALLVLFPSLLVSLGFWLSMSGVFAIFLLLKHWGHLPPWVVGALVVPLGIYLLMAPVSHSLFPVVSPWQHLSPLLSLLFVLFYPLEIFLHLVGMGGVMDPWLGRLWELPEGSVEMRILPGWLLPIYGMMAFAAIRYRAVLLSMLAGSLFSLLWLAW